MPSNSVGLSPLLARFRNREIGHAVRIATTGVQCRNTKTLRCRNESARLAGRQNNGANRVEARRFLNCLGGKDLQSCSTPCGSDTRDRFAHRSGWHRLTRYFVWR